MALENTNRESKKKPTWVTFTSEGVVTSCKRKKEKLLVKLLESVCAGGALFFSIQVICLFYATHFGVQHFGFPGIKSAT